MSVFIERTGSLFESEAQGYAHGVNTDGLMGAGIAVLFKKAYPEMYTHYKGVCANGWLKPGEVLPWTVKNGEVVERYIYNLASQDLPGPHARLEWFESGLRSTLRHAQEHGVTTLAMPRIGCGIGGLEWDDVRDITEHYAQRSPVDIEVWSIVPTLA